QETANWKIDEAAEVTADIFIEHPAIKGVFAANDMMALGVINYLNETGRDDVLVAGFDALKEAETAIVEGQLEVTIDQQADEQGYLGVLYAIRALQGENLPAETFINTIVVTEENVQSR
ncbi:MAG: substrate-binding domain-containing protein, partial [Anaerolineales bacterium]|nr:substrate-binding domain-containing protein [Anaerolineales bacterium]